MPIKRTATQTKKLLLEALRSSLGNVTEACKKLQMSRTQFYNHYKDDPEWAKEVDDVSEIALDFVEGNLFKQIQSGVPSSTIFYLKTKGKKRGYIERLELDNKVSMGENPYKQMTDEELELELAKKRENES